jgi:hypothetical protein
MSQDLFTQLAEYGEFCEEQQWSITADEVFDDVVSGVEPQTLTVRSTQPHRGWLVAGMAAAVVLVLGMLTYLTRQTATDAPAVSQPSPSPIVTTPGPVPSTPTGVDKFGADLTGCEIPSGWLQVCDPASFNEAAMYAVTAGGPGLVAVGANGVDYYSREDDASPGDGANDAVVWTSPDGLTWTRVPHDVVTFGGDGGQQMFGVTAGGRGWWLSVGTDRSPTGGEMQRYGLLLTGSRGRESPTTKRYSVGRVNSGWSV